MSLFIRKKNNPFAKNQKRKNLQQRAHTPFKKFKKNEEIDSDEELLSENGDLSFNYKDEEEEPQLSAQEKKLEMAKKYLEEIKRKELEKQEESEVDVNVLVGKLKDKVLESAGKLRKKIADKLLTTVSKEDFTVLRCNEHKLSISCLAVSRDGKCLYSGSKDGSIVKWCLTEKRKLKSIPGRHKNKSDQTLHDSTVLSMAVSGDGNWLASSDESKIIQVRNASSLEHGFTFTGHSASVTSLVFCPESDTLYSCSADRTVKAWSILERAYIETLFGHQSTVNGIDVLGKNRVVTAGGTDNSLRVWKVEEETQLVFNGPARSLDTVRRINEERMVSGGEDGVIAVWSVARKRPLWYTKEAHGRDPISLEPRWISSVAAIPNTEVFASGSNCSSIFVWKCGDHFKSAEKILEIPVEGFVNALQFTPDERFLIAGVGQEHKLGRWLRIKEAKNSIVIIRIQPKPTIET